MKAARPTSAELSMDRLARQISKQNHLGQVFLRAVITGVGTAIGATVVAGIVLVWLAQIATTIDYIPLVRDVLNAQEIQDALRTAVEPQ